MLNFFKKHLIFEIKNLDLIHSQSELEATSIYFKFDTDYNLNYESVKKFNTDSYTNSLDFVYECLIILNNCGDLILNHIINDKKQFIELSYVFFNYKTCKIEVVKFSSEEIEYSFRSTSNRLLFSALYSIIEQLKDKEINSINEIELFYELFIKAKKTESKIKNNSFDTGTCI